MMAILPLLSLYFSCVASGFFGRCSALAMSCAWALEDEHALIVVLLLQRMNGLLDERGSSGPA